MKKRKITSIALILALVAIMVSGTLAYFTDKTGDVKNEFKTANIDIQLYEHDEVADEEEAGKWTQGEELIVDAEEELKGVEYEGLLPGMSIPKDPTVRVKANSEECWIFVKVDTEVATAKALYKALHDGTAGTRADATAENAIAAAKGLTDFDATKWTFVDFKVDGEKVSFVIRLTETAKKAAADQDFNIFTKIDIPTTWENEDMEALNNATLTFKAYAIQAYGVSAEEAYTELAILG